MSEENVEVVVRQFAGRNARDFAGVMEAWTEDVTLVLRGRAAALSSDSTTGKAAVGEWFGDWFRQFEPDYRFEIEESRDLGDRVFVVVTHHGRGRRSGVMVDQRMAYIFTLREGKVSRMEVWADRDAGEAALKAVGLRE